VGDLNLSGAAMVAVTGLLSALSLAVAALYRQLLTAKNEHIQTLTRELALSQQREAAWKAPAFDSLPIMQAQSEGLTEAVTLAQRRGAV